MDFMLGETGTRSPPQMGDWLLGSLLYALGTVKADMLNK